MKTTKIKVKSEVLKNLVESSGYTYEDISKKLGISSEKIKLGQLTLSQLKKISKLCQTSLAAFFSETFFRPPIIHDYRITRQKKLSPQVFLAQKKAYILSRELYSLTNKNSNIPDFGKEKHPEMLAKKFRDWLKAPIIKDKPPKSILREYKKIIEEKMYIPVIELSFKADDVRAFSVPSEVTTIVLNEEDTPQIKLFSLFHEVAHILKKNEGICSIELESSSQNIETFCNRFSAEFLIPKEDLEEEIKKREIVLDEKGILKIAKIYGVSVQVIWLRLLWLGYIDKLRYEQFKAKFSEEKKKKFGIKNWEEIFFNRAGRLVLSEIVKGYKKGEVSYVDAINLLGIKSKYFERFVQVIEG